MPCLPKTKRSQNPGAVATGSRVKICYPSINPVATAPRSDFV